MGLALQIFPPAATLVAGATALVLALVGRRLPRASSVRQPLALAAGYFAGHVVLLRSWTALVPQQAWDWLAYLGIAAAAAGALTSGRGRAGRWIALAASLLLAACLLTPSWPIVGVPWPASIAISGAYLFGLAALLELFPPRISAALEIGVLALAAAAVSVCVAAAISIQFAQRAAIASAALAGCAVACIARDQSAIATQAGISLVYLVLVGGIALTACFYPEQPLLALLLLPAAPLVARPFAWRTIS